MNANEPLPPGQETEVPAQRPPSSDLEDPRVIEALDEYVAALEAGRKPDRERFLAKHPEVAAAVAECLEGMEMLHVASSKGSQPAGGNLGPGWQPGTPLGDFRIIREIGRGGMGVVYEAEQLSLGRRIALKVLPFALTLDPRQLQRFKNEARAAAQLHHQHIVPVYNVGSERGVHFYAMQYIEGQSLAEVIQQQQQLARAGKAASAPAGNVRSESAVSYVPRSGAPAAETAVEPVGALATAYSKNSTQFHRIVAQLGVQAAEALEHAHQCGVIHRDIKPGNLLVEGHGQLWITDFGLAQFQTDAGLTHTGDLIGTLRYMSPEQAAGQRISLDQRTDVYSLGATLYELLTLQPPFLGTDRQTLLQQILHDEPRPPRAIDKSIPSELETIILKALAKVPAERYATARELADDLLRFLQHQPIRARRATLPQRLRKWARRHPSFVWAGVLLCVLTAAVSVISAGMIQEAYDQERMRARQAEDSFLLAKQWVDEMFKICEEDLADQPQFDGLRGKLLENALVYYQKLIEQNRDAPDDQAELTANRARVQKILTDLADLQGAGQLRLLREPAVLDDLGVTDQKRDQIAAVWQRLDRRPNSFRGFDRMSQAERRERFLDLARSEETAFEGVVTPRELRRLRQIDLQKQGLRAFEDTKVIRSLRLTGGQKEQIRRLRDEAFRKGPCGLKPQEGPGKPPMSPPLPSVESTVMAVLTAEQQRTWQELTGRPFKAPPGHPFSPPGFGLRRHPPDDHHGHRDRGPGGWRDAPPFGHDKRPRDKPPPPRLKDRGPGDRRGGPPADRDMQPADNLPPR
jgi:serine/threonine protein kinase